MTQRSGVVDIENLPSWKRFIGRFYAQYLNVNNERSHNGLE